MAVSNKKRDSLARRDASRTGRVLRRTATAVDGALSVVDARTVSLPTRDVLNKLLLTLGIRALITGIALTLISPTLPVFVGVNVLMVSPFVARHLYKRRTGSAPRLGNESQSSLSTAAIVDAVRGTTKRSSGGRDRL